MSLHPILQYERPDEALEFLQRAFGFTEHAVMRDDEGKIGHAEIRAGGGIIMFGGTGGHVGQGWNYVGGIEDVDALHDRAAAAGAEITMGLTDQPYGSREFGARDLEGNEWAFGTYSPE